MLKKMLDCNELEQRLLKYQLGQILKTFLLKRFHKTIQDLFIFTLIYFYAMC